MLFFDNKINIYITLEFKYLFNVGLRLKIARKKDIAAIEMLATRQEKHYSTIYD